MNLALPQTRQHDRNIYNTHGIGRVDRKDRGFSLVVALVLLSFIFTLLLSLTTMTLVELQGSAQNNTMIQARQNATLGVMVALGELQRLSGPDRRITASADILSTENFGETADPDKRQWTGVWDSSLPVNQGFLGWLVSGNQNTNITNASEPLPSANTITLVGTGSVETTDSDGNPTQNEVDAELVSIQSSDGLDTGAYAYWIGDEGIKARINLSDPYAENAPGGVNEDILGNATRFAIPVKSELRRIDPNLSYQPENSEFGQKLERIIDGKEMALLGADLQSFVQEYHHDFTTRSAGLFSNVRDGGLRHDLSRGLDDQFEASGLKDESIFTYGNGSRGPTWNLFHEYFQQHKKIQNADSLNPTIAPYAPRLANNNSLNSTNYLLGTVDSTPDHSGATNDQIAFVAERGLHPVLLKATVKIYPVVETDAVNGTSASMRIYPFFILWNPYNITLTATNYQIDLEIGEQEFSIRTAAEDSHNPTDDPETDDSTIKYEKYHFQDNTAYIVTTKVRVSANYKQPLDLAFETDSIALSPGEIITLGLDIPEDETFDETNVYPISSQIFSQQPGTNNPSITFQLPITDVEFKLNDFIEVFWNTNGGIDTSINLSLTDGSLLQRMERIRMRGRTTNAELGYRTAYQHLIKNSDPHPIGPSWALKGTANEYFLNRCEYPPFAYFNPRSIFSSSAYLQPGYFQNSSSIEDIPHNVLWGDINPGTEWKQSENPAPALLTNTTAVWGFDHRNHTLGKMPRPDVPRIIAFDVSRIPPLSLGNFQHAPLNITSSGPAYPLGNSLAPVWDGSNPASDQTENRLNDLDQVDLSYRLNEEIWDNFFISTIPSDSTLTSYSIYEGLSSFGLDYLRSGSLLANPRIDYVEPETITVDNIDTVRDYDQAAVFLLNKGAFNINSTSPDAWKAILSAHAEQNLKIYDWPNNEPEKTVEGTGIDRGVPISRTTYPNSLPAEDLSASVEMTNNGDGTYWNGFRRLTTSELDQLVTAIVSIIRERGPFRSLSEFVNRELSGQDDRALRGPLEQALVDSGINEPDVDSLFLDNGRADVSYFGAKSTASGWKSNYHKVIDWGGTHQPGWVSQADILQILAPIMQARSDTFVIRAYGEARNPINNEVTASAWCEVTVQRYPELVSQGTPQPIENLLGDATGSGRAYRVIDFRWLDPDEV